MNRLTERVDHPDRKKTFFIFNGYFFKSLFLQNNYIYVLFFTAFQTCLSLFVSCCWEQCAPCLLFSRHECLSRVLMYFPMNVYQDSSVISPKSLYVFPQESICISSEPGARSRSLANFSLDRVLAISSSTPFPFVIIVIDIMIETIIIFGHIIASDGHNVIIVFQCKAQ